MAAGDLITRRDQMEIWRSDTNRVLIGGGTDLHIDGIEGVDNPSMKDNDSGNPSKHGSISGTDRFEDRQVKCEMIIVSKPSTKLVTHVARMSKVFTPIRPNEDDAILTWWPKDINKVRLVGRPRRTFWRYESSIIWGTYVNFTWRFDAMDPRFYDHIENSQTLTMPVGSSSQSIDINNAGNIETDPILEITGPCENIRVSNLLDSNRQLKIDIVLTATDTLIIDFKNRTVSLGGEDRYGAVRADNQWFELLPGVNRLTYVRSGSTGAASFMTVRWRNAWSSVAQEVEDYTPPPGPGGGGTYSDVY